MSKPRSGSEENGSKERGTDAIIDTAHVFHSQESLPAAIVGEGLAGAVVDAARRCMLRVGFEKTSMADVARLAGVSRGSIYNHFEEREHLVKAVTALGTELLMTDLEAAMESAGGLEDGIGRAAVVIGRWRAASRQRRWGGLFEDSDAALLLTSQSADLLRRIESILRPHIETGTTTGDVRPNLDVDQATEWLTRMLISLVAHPPATFDEDVDSSVAGFVTSFCIRGLL